MKKLFVPLLIFVMLVPAEKAFSLFGVGVYGLNDPISVDGWTDSRFNGLVTLEGKGFEKAFGFGGFLYIDAIPFIDLEASFELAGRDYDFQFKNAFAELPEQPFGWGRVSSYLTLRRKLFGVGVPILGGVKLHLGGGLNRHSTTPLASISTMEELLGGNLQADFDPDKMKDNLVEYLKENKIDSKGYHIQVGAQVKLLALNAFINYRITRAKDVVPGEDGFSSLWIGLAFGL